MRQKYESIIIEMVYIPESDIITGSRGNPFDSEEQPLAGEFSW